MNELRLSKKAKIFTIVNTILIIYIFSLTIGYSLLSENLNITGTVTADNPDLNICPLELREINAGESAKGTLGSDGFKRYFLEKSDYDLLYTENINDNISPSSIIDSYDAENNLYSFLASNEVLYPSDKKNTNNMCSDDKVCPINEYKALSNPIYFIFENKTAYPLENFVIKKDEENDVTPAFPLTNIDIRWKKYTSYNEAIESVTKAENNVDTWNEFKSIFENYLTSKGEGTYGAYYAYEDFYNLNQMSFKTDTIDNGQFLVIGMSFNDVAEATYDSETISREDDGISFKFWEEKFTTNSAFKMRYAFTSYQNVKSFYTSNISGEFYTKPLSYTYPISWWNK